MIHPTAWLIWLGAAIVALSATRNPLYLTLLLGCFWLVGDSIRRSGRSAPLPLTPQHFALFVIPLAALFNGLSVHSGATVWARLPEVLPFLGGPLTLEALIYGALNGLSLAAFYAAFAVLNQALPIRDLLRLVPRAFYPLAVVLSIAVTFAPATLRQIEQVREAQAVRGHRVRGLRDWLPLFMPLLVGGMERALQLAETLSARGFAGEAGTPPGLLAGMTAALAALLAGLLLVAGGNAAGGGAWGMALAMLGGLGLVGLTVAAGRRVRHTRYRHQRWAWRDTVVVSGALLAMLPLFLHTALDYTPYPVSTLPPFAAGVGVALLGLLAPLGFCLKHET